MPLSPSRVAAETLRVLPRKGLSRMLGRLADVPAPQPLLDQAMRAYVRAYGIDMSEYVVPEGGFRTFDDFFTRRLFPEYGKHCGVVIQSMLRRSAGDIEALIGLGARVRLCKGAYLESEEVAFPDKADVDRNYLTLMERLLTAGNYPGLATHDERIIAQARRFVEAQKIPADRFQFQMLYGVRRDLQERLRRAGYRMRVYIPFGTQWYPYLMRRLAERPANIAFILGNVVRESVPGRRAS